MENAVASSEADDGIFTRRFSTRGTRRTRTSEEETEEAPLLPEHICRNETERHVWRGEVLTFIRDHVEAAETYRLSLTDLEAGELLPSAPEWLIQDEYEERTRIGFALERLGKTGECGGAHPGLLASRHTHTDAAPEPADRREEADGFRTTRLDIDNGPEVSLIERK